MLLAPLVAVADVAAVDDEDDGVAAAVVAAPQPAQAVLPADVPELEVEVWQGDGADVLADGRDGGGWGWGGVCGWGWGQVQGFDLGEEGRFAGVVEAEEDNGVFCGVGLSE